MEEKHEIVSGLLTEGYFFRWNNVHRDINNISLSFPNHIFILFTGESENDKAVENLLKANAKV